MTVLILEIAADLALLGTALLWCILVLAKLYMKL